uniref:NADH dehydrogenase subunit 4L n=1 Tax=Cyanoptyche gloeocystis TaxID=77922 RepID=A0A096Y6Y8_9EUKA|nr:NADH dehydrogenase subunit 4L [Cyanoptyche gloeocystis]AIM52091.1 NADH dehydrogenase subunit 4L [Cyanoptyche gloeocystis]
MIIEITHFLFVSITIFLISLIGIFYNRKNIILLLISLELMLLAINLQFVIFSCYMDDFLGQIATLFILTIAAAESAIGLALLVIYYKKKGTISVEKVNILKG